MRMMDTRSYRRALLDRDLAAARDYLKGTVLDVGGGRQRGNFRMPEGVRHVIIDIDPSKHPDILADAAKIPLKSGSVDCVKCTELLEHARHPEDVVREIARVIKPNGALLLSVPFLSNIHADPHDYQRFTDVKLREMLEEQGLRVIELKKEGLFFTVLGDMIKRAILKAHSRLAILWYWMLPLLDLLVKLDGHDRVRKSDYMGSFVAGYFIVAVKKAGEAT